MHSLIMLFQLQLKDGIKSFVMLLKLQIKVGIYSMMMLFNLQVQFFNSVQRSFECDPVTLTNVTIQSIAEQDTS